MKINIKKIILLIIIYIATILIINTDTKHEFIRYKEYIGILEEKYNKDINQILKKLEQEINETRLCKYDYGRNLLLYQHYNYANKNYQEVIENYDSLERYFLKYGMKEELLYLYSMLAGIYVTYEKYTESYIFIYKGEKLAKELYEKYKNENMLSELIAIRYLKVTIAHEIGMEDEADKVFKEAEILRSKYKGKEKIDIYYNILLYYKNKENADLMIKYANKILKLTKDSVIQYNTYISTNIILAKAYLKLGSIDKCIQIANGIKSEDDKLPKHHRCNLYTLYAMIYEHYGQTESQIKYLEMAYNEIKDTTMNRKQLVVLNDILKVYTKENNKDEIIKWFKVYRDKVNDLEDYKNTQYLMSEIIDTDLQVANSNIEILKLQKYNSNYIVIILGMMTTIVILFAISINKRKKHLEENMKILNHQLEYQYNYYENIKKCQEKTRRIWHDMKNHISILYELIDKKEYKDVKSYINELDIQITNAQTRVITNNKIIDAILTSKLEVCKLKSIKVDLDIKIPSKINISDFDISVILGNLLDNAIEACENIQYEDLRYIKIKSGIKGQYLFINIKNSLMKEVIKSGNKFITIKKDKENHGIGIDSVINSIENYNGDIRVDYNDEEFNVFILLDVN
ncbi:ATP-binding protein [Romboutsia lituseburensis]|uniref:ATP-binding protein n=1 Tax=Romboutsia lituseburensis TaxID=1537 RepID=UPI00215B5FEA|nr:ATP-binding protein [Romboutsia lituseburensis]MCR8746297.1 ATP-binding protein [Romboutsia lituseburensis]